MKELKILLLGAHHTGKTAFLNRIGNISGNNFADEYERTEGTTFRPIKFSTSTENVPEMVKLIFVDTDDQLGTIGATGDCDAAIVFHDVVTLREAISLGYMNSFHETYPGRPIINVLAFDDSIEYTVSSLEYIKSTCIGPFYVISSTNGWLRGPDFNQPIHVRVRYEKDLDLNPTQRVYLSYASSRPITELLTHLLQLCNT